SAVEVHARARRRAAAISARLQRNDSRAEDPLRPRTPQLTAKTSKVPNKLDSHGIVTRRPTTDDRRPTQSPITNHQETKQWPSRSPKRRNSPTTSSCRAS